MSDLVGNPEDRFSRVEAHFGSFVDQRRCLLCFTCHLCSVVECDEKSSEPVHDKTNNLGFRPGPTQTSLYSHRRNPES